jgi:hypothetical protein
MQRKLVVSVVSYDVWRQPTGQVLKGQAVQDGLPIDTE